MFLKPGRGGNGFGEGEGGAGARIKTDSCREDAESRREISNGTSAVEVAKSLSMAQGAAWGFFLDRGCIPSRIGEILKFGLPRRMQSPAENQ